MTSKSYGIDTDIDYVFYTLDYLLTIYGGTTGVWTNWHLAAMNRKQEKVTQLLLEAELSGIVEKEAETKQQLDQRS